MYYCKTVVSLATVSDRLSAKSQLLITFPNQTHCMIIRAMSWQRSTFAPSWLFSLSATVLLVRGAP
jgi:hypothetical protein